ncbi:MAG: DnaJ domain-containing protein [Alphaproteobacteria bacterium]|nr:DnaJ domain-containing protein [Alphaproteobacteria bacterium]
MRDPHEILGITKAASEAEIKRAFRAKAKLYHPDLHPGDTVIEHEFCNIVKAYHACLKRRQDKNQTIPKSTNFSEELHRAGAKPPSKPSKAKPPNNAPFPEDTVDVGNGRAQGHQDKPTPPTPPTPTAAPKKPKKGLGSFFKDAFFGSFENMVQQHLNRRANPTQKASDAAKDAGGDRHFTLDVGFVEARNGTKKTLKLNDGRLVQVKISPETRQGQTLRLQGMGLMIGRGHCAGDALVRINIIDDLYAERSNNDFFLRLPVTIAEAALGAEICIPGLYQDLMLKIPSGSNSGTNLRLKSKGFKDEDTGVAGDQYVTLEVKLPSHIDRRLHTFLDEWSKDFDYDVRKSIGMGGINNNTKKETNS